MKKKILSAALSVVLVVSLVGQTNAVEQNTVVVNETAIEMSVEPHIVNGNMFVAYHPIVEAIYPDSVATWENGGAMVRDQGLELFMQPGTQYIICNGRYLYTSDQLFIANGEVMVPLRVLGEALGAQVSWDTATGTAALTSGQGPIQSGSEFYEAETLYWLSQIINAESGNQALEGKIAVGNVVMNRVASPIFPNTVQEVIFQRNQFSPVQNGSIYMTPNEESVIAAKLVMDGANTAGDSLYFVNPQIAPNSWAAQNCAYVSTIGSHAFFA